MQDNHTQLLDEGEKNEKAQISRLPSSYGIDFRPEAPQDPKQNTSIDKIAQTESKVINYLSYFLFP